MAKTWLITGASHGMGRELVEQALERGDRVAATLRQPGHLDDLAARHGARFWRRELDVTETAGLRTVVNAASRNTSGSTWSSPTPDMACSASPRI